MLIGFDLQLHQTLIKKWDKSSNVSMTNYSCKFLKCIYSVCESRCVNCKINMIWLGIPESVKWLKDLRRSEVGENVDILSHMIQHQRIVKQQIEWFKKSWKIIKHYIRSNPCVTYQSTTGLTACDLHEQQL